MIINRHNYEEFFLLYVDNELRSEERTAVEEFLQQNSDLGEEMEMLFQSKLQDEQLPFPQKEILFNHSQGISLENYEEFFLRSVDGELTGKESLDVEKFVLKHPELQDEYVLLQKTKLEPEEVVFAGKSKLYKREGTKRILLSPWLKMSAAAAVMGIIFITWIFQHNETNQVGRLVSTDPPKRAKTPTQQFEPKAASPQINETVATLPKEAPTRNSSNKALLSSVRGKQTKTPYAIVVNRKQRVAENGIKNNTEPVFATTDKTPSPDINAGKKVSPDEGNVATATSPNRNNLPSVNEVDKSTRFTNEAVGFTSPLAKHAVYREIDSQDDDEEKTFYIGSAEINKNKLKGLFKKAVNFLGKRNDQNEGQKSVRIAGFEIKSN